MRLAVVGPAHPYKGGIVHHTTELAHRLAAAGHEADLVSWSAQYPQLLYPGQRVDPADPPELPPYPRTSYPLSWRRPDGWWREARRLRRGGYDAVLLVVVTPVQAPAYLVMQTALRRGDAARGWGGRSSTAALDVTSAPAPPQSRPRVLAICHNVMPHESRFFDRPLTRAVLDRVDGLLVHSPGQAELAAGLTTAPVEVAALPPHLPVGTEPAPAADPRVRRRLLFFGIVRQYKGLDVLLRALAEVPDVALTVAGEFWGGTAATEELVASLGLAGRVTLRPGYVPAERIPGLFADADALVLPYRSGTASQNVWLAHTYGLPVIATRTGTLAEHVRDGVDGLVCAPDDPAELAAAVRRFYEPGVPERLRAAARPPQADPLWSEYLAALDKLATR